MRREHTGWTNAWVWIGLLALLASACSSSSQADGDADTDGSPDADGDADADGDGDGDADGDSDGDGDADADIEEDADGPEPLRRLVERRLFGEMPLSNGFYDPGFSQLDGIGWSAVGRDHWDTGEMTRVFMAETPMGQPALLVPFDGNPSGLTVTGAAKGAAGPAEVSVWIGRVSGTDDPALAEITASLMGLFPGGRRDEAVNLEADESGPTLTLDGIRWRRFVAHLPEGPIGWAHLSVTDGTDGDFYLSSPILVPLDAESGARLIRRQGPLARRPLCEAELNALAIQRDAMGERF